jgi:uncharacterized protein (DUF2147 family)
MTHSNGVVGTWMVPAGDATVTIAPCGKLLCGTISWMKVPVADSENPDLSKRNRPLLGAQVLWGFVFNPDNNRWEDGKIYDPDSGDTYQCIMTLIDRNALKVKGFVGFKWAPIGRTEIWTRSDSKQ